jgi:hypothetical protein
MTDQGKVGGEPQNLITLYDQNIKCSCGKYVQSVGANIDDVNKILVAKDAQLDLLKADNHRLRLGSLSPIEYINLLGWLNNPNREPAQTHFTAGACRDAARAFERSNVFGEIASLKLKYDELHDQRHVEARKADDRAAEIDSLEREVEGLKSALKNATGDRFLFEKRGDDLQKERDTIAYQLGEARRALEAFKNWSEDLDNNAIHLTSIRGSREECYEIVLKALAITPEKASEVVTALEAVAHAAYAVVEDRSLKNMGALRDALGRLKELTVVTF